MKRICNWTDQEDKLLLELYGQVDCFQKWKFISEKFKKKGIHKSQIQCRQRYVNRLNPELRQDKLEVQQLRNLFQYYDQYGPLWSVFQSLIPGRNQNLLKNKFYSTLRSLVRILIASAQKNCNEKSSICSTSLSSKLLAKKVTPFLCLDFRKYKGVFRSILNKMNFELDLEKTSFIKSQINQQIVQKIKKQIEKSKGPSKNKRNRKEIVKDCQKKGKMEQSLLLKINESSNIVELTRQKPLENMQNQPKNEQIRPIMVQHQYANFFLSDANCFGYFVPLWQYSCFPPSAIN